MDKKKNLNSNEEKKQKKVLVFFQVSCINRFVSHINQPSTSTPAPSWCPTKNIAEWEPYSRVSRLSGALCNLDAVPRTVDGGENQAPEESWVAEGL